MEAGGAYYLVMHPGAQAELRQQPNKSAAGHDETPSPPHGKNQNVRGDHKKSHVHGQDVQQRRTVDEKQRAQNCSPGVSEIEVKQVVDGGAVSMRGEGRDYGEYHG